MNKNKKDQNYRRRIFFGSRSGSVIAYALIITSIVSIILVSILQYISSQIRFSSNRVHRESAFQVAESGVYFYRWYLAHSVAGRTAQQIQDFWENGDPYGVGDPYEADFFDPEGGVIGRYSIEVDPPEAGSTIVLVKSTGWTYAEPEAKRTVQVRFRRPSWSESAVLANDNMRFGQGTFVNGRIHSNRGIRFDGTANNIISSSWDMYDDPDHSGNNEFGVHTHVNAPPGSGINNSFRSNEAPPTDPVPNRPDVFQAGRQLSVVTVDFNGVLSDLNYMKTVAQSGESGSLYFTRTNSDGTTVNLGRRIILGSGNTFGVCTVRSVDTNNNRPSVITSYYRNSGGGSCATCSGLCLRSYSYPNNGVIFVENDAWVEGTINNKKLSIVAANLGSGNPANLYIGINNINYTNFDGRDIIGLIGQRYVDVVYNSQNDLTISGALLAQSGRVGRAYYAGNYKNSITVNGSIATNQRYGFAYTDGTGYQTRTLNFDNNLLYYPPPYFPTGTEYHIDQWEEL